MFILQRLINVIADLYMDLIFYSNYRPGLAYLLGMLSIVLIGGLTFYFSRRLQSLRFPLLRGIEGIDDLDRNVETAAETGKAVHFSLGTGSLGDGLTLQTLAGIDFMREMGLRTAAAGPPLVVTTSSALALPIMESTVQNAYAETSGGIGFQPDNNRFIAPTPVAYAAGVMRVIADENIGFNVMVGSFGPEYLLMGEAGARNDAKQLVAAADPTVLPFVVATADYPVIGEELFALGSYLRPSPARIGSLIAQDAVRLVIVILIVALTIAVSLDPDLGKRLGFGY
ncbi:MAG: hypothetical protein Q7O66_03080 [Dehalococcoidia bacterium]|nr:hypothetical protein [Dehalococcoidia bacterium]